jgi:hypothetical protein
MAVTNAREVMENLYFVAHLMDWPLQRPVAHADKATRMLMPVAIPAE